MKNILSLFLLCSFCYGYAQTPDWVWARSAKSDAGGVGEGYVVATDNSNNVFVAGLYIDSIVIGSYGLRSNLRSAYIAKYDANGNTRWLKGNACQGNTSLCFGYGVCADRSGGSYLTGPFSGSVSFGAFTLTNSGNYDVFLVKYDSSGSELWARRAGGGGDDQANDAACDALGNIYITGYFSSPTIIFGSYTLTNTGSSNFFIAKYDSSGNVLWAKSAAGTGNDNGYGVAVDANGNAYVTGSFLSPSISFGTHTLTNTGNYDIFLAKYDSSGNAIWARSAVGSTYDYGRKVAADSAGNTYLTGYFYSPSLSFGTHTITNSGSYDAFVAKYDSSGNALWAKDIGDTAGDYGYGVAVDRAGKVYITGGFSSDSITFDTITFHRPPVHPDPMYFICADTAGHALWIKVLPSGGDDESGVAVSPSGCVFLGGDFYQVNPFIVGPDSLHLLGLENVFVAKICDNSIAANFISSDTAFCTETGMCINFFDHSSGYPTSWQWHFPGATPDTSSLQNPINICYTTPGTYPVSLIISNGVTSDTLTVSPLIIYGTAPAVPTITLLGGDTLVSSFGYSYQWFLNGNAIAGATDSFCVAYQGGTYAVQVSDSFGSCHAISNGELITSIGSLSNEGIRIYPNPVDEEFTVYGLQFTVVKELEIYDVLGEVLDVQSPEIIGTGEINNPKSKMRINTRALPDGIYFLKLRGRPRGTVMKKFVVLHK